MSFLSLVSEDFGLEILGLLLGVLQGLFEWLPVSSEGQLVIFLTKLVNADPNIATTLALFAHIGTAFVVLLYFREDYWRMIEALVYYGRSLVDKQDRDDQIKEEDLRLARNVFLTTLATVPVALVMLVIFEELVEELSSTLPLSVSDVVTIMVGLFLIATGLILRSRPSLDQELSSLTLFEHLSWKQAILLGLLQGLAALPGISRSGITVTYLLVGSKLDQHESLRGSFLVAMPVSLGAGFLQVVRQKVIFMPGGIADADSTVVMTYFGGLMMMGAAFVVGGLTLKGFLDLAKKIPFDLFMFFFGAIAVVAGLFGLM